MARIDWCMRHINSTNFYSVFFTDECTLYLDNPSGSRWVKVEEDNIIYSKNKGRKIGAWAGISYQGKTSLFLYEDSMSSVNYIEILKEALEEIRSKLNSDEVMLQMDNARYHWTTLDLEFYSNNGIIVIDWPPYSPDLNPIENIWAFMKKQLEGKRFAQ